MKNLMSLFLSSLFLIIPLAHGGTLKIEIDSKLQEQPSLLTYEYREIHPNEQYTIVYQNMASFLTPSSKNDFLIIGPLHPCIGIVLFNQENRHILAFHKHFTSEMGSIAPLIAFLKNKSPTQIRGLIYSVNYPQYNRTLSQGRSQYEELEFTKAFLSKNFDIPIQNLEFQLMNLDQDSHLGMYMDTFKFLLVDKTGGVYFTGPYAEDIARVRRKDLFRDILKATPLNLESALTSEEFKDFKFLGAQSEAMREIGTFATLGSPDEYSDAFLKTNYVMKKRLKAILRQQLKLGQKDLLPWEKLPYKSVPFFLAPPSVLE